MGNNPTERSILAGWQIMHKLCKAERPGPELFEFVKAFARRAAFSELKGKPDKRKGWAIRRHEVAVAEEARNCLTVLGCPIPDAPIETPQPHNRRTLPKADTFPSNG